VRKSIALLLALSMVSASASATFWGGGEDNSTNQYNDQRNTQTNLQNQSSESNSRAMGVGVGVGLGVGIADGGNAYSSNRNNIKVNATGGKGGHAKSESSAVSGDSVSGSSAVSGDSISGSSASTGASTATVNYSVPATQHIKYSGSYRMENTPDVTLVTAQPTAPCIVPLGGGGSGPGFSLTLSGGIKDDTCSVLETRRIAWDNPTIIAESDEYLLEEIRMLKAKQREAQKRGTSAGSVGGFGY